MKVLFTRPMIIISTLLLLVFAVWTAALTFTGSQTTIFNNTYSPAAAVFYLCGVIIATRGALTMTLKSTAGKMLGSVALAFLFYAIADLVWGYYTVVANVEIPYPSAADIFYLLYYPFMAGTFFFLYTMFGSTVTVKKIIEAAAVFIASFVLIFFSIIRPELPTDGSFSLSNVFDIAYPLFDVVMVTLVYLGIRISSGKIKTVLPFFLFGLGLEVFCDLWFSLATGAENYINGGLIDWLYLAASYSVFLGIASVIISFSAPSATKSKS